MPYALLQTRYPLEWSNEMTERVGDLESSTWLSDLIGGLLIALARAQNMSNEYSAKLGTIYQETPDLRVFPVPNGCINSVSVELKVGMEGVGISHSAPESVRTYALEVLQKHISEILNTILPSLATSLRRFESAFPSAKAARMADALGRPAWRHALLQEALDHVSPHLNSMISSNGALNRESAANILGNALGKVVDHPDYDPIPEEIRKELRAEIQHQIEAPERMQALSSRLSNRPPDSEPRLSIQTDAQNLNSLGPELVGNLQVMAGVRSFIVQAESIPSATDTTDPPKVKFRLVPAKH
jgi:hypothetical protein